MPDQLLSVGPAIGPEGRQQGGENGPLREAAGRGNRARAGSKFLPALGDRSVIIIVLWHADGNQLPRDTHLFELGIL